jgi:NAD(P)H-hydrate epimerase
VASFSACYTTVPLVEDREGIIDQANVVDLTEAREKFDAWAIGPGLGRSEGVAELVARLYRVVPRPIVVDADGLNGLADVLRREQDLLANPPSTRILTPHSGEFARLSGGASIAAAERRVEQAAALCQSDPSGNTIVVLKGHRTVVSDGRRVAINATGNPGMATGGAGDCLTGVIAALAAQGLSAWDAARLGVHVHGLAGDLAASRLGQVSMTATDIVDCLPQAFQQVAA